MKNIILFLSILLLSNCVGKDNTEKKINTPSKKTEPAYNDSLAKRLGADEYGMKRYVMAFLKRGKKVITDSTARADLQKKHLQNIERLAEEGKLIVAGPFLNNKEIRGIFIFNVESVKEAEKLTALIVCFSSVHNL